MTNELAIKLNETIISDNKYVYNLLSKKGKDAFFPSKGIISQSAEAKSSKINATIGVALGDDSLPMELKSLTKYIDLHPTESLSYASTYGNPKLRQMWKEEIQRKNLGLKNTMSMPVVTNALTHGLSILGQLFLNEGDKIIMPDKYWGNYKLIFEAAHGAEISTFNTFDNNKFDIKSLKEKFTGYGKKVLLLNFPNNPTGYSPTKIEVEEIAKIVKDYASEDSPVLIISDDAYFGLLYEDGYYEESPFSIFSELDKHVLAVKVDGITKEYFAWGLRVGFLTFSGKDLSAETLKALEDKTAGMIRGNISNVPNISQSLVIKTLESKEFIEEQKAHFLTLKERYDEVKRVLAEEDEKYKEYFEALPFNSGYFMCVNLKKNNEEKIRKLLIEKYSTGVIATGSLLRIAFSSVRTEYIKELFDNIYSACKESLEE